MMNKRFAVALLSLASALTLSAALSAQTLREIGPPAEFPPPDFAGRQYVDSRGCVYIRAGFDGNVTWVPRATRDREALCGYEPTLIDRTAVDAAPVVPDAPGTPAPPSDPLAAPAIAAPAPSAAGRATPSSAPVPTIVAGPAPAAAVAPAAAAPKRVVRAPVATPSPAPSPTGVSPAPAQAPVVASAGTVVRSVDRNGVFTVSGGPRLAVPAGYRKAWGDGRLNQDRGKQTLTGALQTALVWTQQVPRRLVDRSSGRDMTEKLSYLVYPYTDYDKQLADLRAGTHVTVQDSRGQRLIVKRSAIQVSSSGRASVAVQPHVSTKSVTAPTLLAKPAAPAASGYVTVGTFANQASALKVQKRLAALGLPVRLAKFARGNADHRLVMVGPLSGPALTGALSTVRGAGYPRAKLR